MAPLDGGIRGPVASSIAQPRADRIPSPPRPGRGAAARCRAWGNVASLDANAAAGGTARMTDYAAAREIMVDRQVRPSDVTLYPIIAAMLDVPARGLRARGAAAGRLPRRARAAGARTRAPRPAGLRQAARRAQRRAERPGPRRRLRPTATRPPCSRGWPRRSSPLETDPAHGGEAEALLAAQGVDTAVVETGPLADGVAEHGPFDAMLVEGAIEVLPAGARGPAEAGRADRRHRRRRRPRPGAARPAGRRRHRLAAYLRCNGPGATGLRGDESV